jgi:hypothetical protein
MPRLTITIASLTAADRGNAWSDGGCWADGAAEDCELETIWLSDDWILSNESGAGFAIIPLPFALLAFNTMANNKNCGKTVNFNVLHGRHRQITGYRFK